MMTFATFFSPMYFAERSSAITASSIALLSASAANCIWKRALPLNEMVICTVDSTRYFSSNSGHGASHTVPWLPSKCHSSSAMCGAKGAMSLTSVSSTPRLRHFICAISPTHIMKAATDVL